LVLFGLLVVAALNVLAGARVLLCYLLLNPLLTDLTWVKETNSFLKYQVSTMDEQLSFFLNNNGK
jgi:hypothetical protein